MRFFDLHCDTLYEIVKKRKSIYSSDLNVSLKKAKSFEAYIGCYAVWIPDNLRGKDAFEFFKKCKDVLYSEEKIYGDYFKVCKSKKDLDEVLNLGKSGVILTIEGSEAIGEDISNVKYLSDSGVKIITLTWNGHSKVGDGVGILNPKGLTNFGKKLLKKLDQHNIIVDVSHASEKLFYGVCEFLDGPIIATHSNSKKICQNKRNLSDDQFKCIKEKGGIVGITFCKDFLNGSNDAGFEDILKHMDHFLSLSGEDVLAIGSDFDGADLPNSMSGMESLKNLYEYLLSKSYKESLLDKIFFSNGYNFIKKFTN